MKLLSSIVSLSILFGGVVATPSFAGLADTYETQQTFSYETATFGAKMECKGKNGYWRYFVGEDNTVYSVSEYGYYKKEGYIGRSYTHFNDNGNIIDTEWDINKSGVLVRYSQINEGSIYKTEFIRLAPLRAGYSCS